ncbi:hypothetical protein [uncultured Streptomyces sp.]|uniref:hypothetical protein n=1 Tax=uncultured Streptomyces sp. TaxID=174707 RepID=UPI0026384127|nr:hypothetical protein [uncultured Streptomyces sp.]
MSGGGRNGRRPRKIAQGWFWAEVFEAATEFVRSRGVWVVVGNAGTFFTALAALVHYWSRPLPFGAYAVVQLGCLAWQAIALLPVVLPGRAATLRDAQEFADLHEGMTVLTLCGSGIFGMFPGVMLLIAFGVDSERPPWGALLFSGTALMLACVAGLCLATGVSHRVQARYRAAGPPGVSHWQDGGDGFADADAGGSDGD